MNEEQYAELSRLFTERDVRSGQPIYSEGDLLEHLCLLTEGMVKIFKRSLSGKEFIIAFIGPGAVLGNVALCSGLPHPSAAQAVIDSKLLSIRNDDLTFFLQGHPEISFKILRRMLIGVGIRFTMAARCLTDLATERADRRLAYILFKLSLQFGLILLFTHEEVGQMAGTTSETATRFLNRLKEMGIIHCARRSIIILDQKRLGLLIEDSPQIVEQAH